MLWNDEAHKLKFESALNRTPPGKPKTRNKELTCGYRKMTYFMREIQAEIQRIQDDFNRTLFHIVKNNDFIYEDLESSRRPETLLPVNQTIQYLDELKSVADEFQARTAKSGEKIHELAEISDQSLRVYRENTIHLIVSIQARFSELSDEESRRTHDQLSTLLGNLSSLS